MLTGGSSSPFDLPGSLELSAHAGGSSSPFEIPGSLEWSAHAGGSSSPFEIPGSLEWSAHAGGSSSPFEIPASLEWSAQAGGSSGFSSAGQDVGFQIGGGASDLAYIAEASAERDVQTGDSSSSTDPHRSGLQVITEPTGSGLVSRNRVGAHREREGTPGLDITITIRVTCLLEAALGRMGCGFRNGLESTRIFLPKVL